MDNSLQKFVISCQSCQKENRNTTTLIYVDFEKRRYYFTCFNPACGATEVFDENGEKILATDVNEAIASLIEKKEKEKKEKEDKGETGAN